MIAKTARRFLSRNEFKMIAHKLSIKKQKPSFIKRWKLATKTLQKVKA